MKKLYKSETDRYICGVCGGIAAYLGVDSTIVRLIFAALGIVGGSGILLYIAAAVIMPKGDPVVWEDTGKVNGEPLRQSTENAQSAQDIQDEPEE